MARAHVVIRILAAGAAVLMGLAGCTAPGPAQDAPRSHRLLLNGAQIAAVEQGSGPLIVFVHGAAGDWRTWEPLRPLVAREARFVSYSRRDHWPNAWPDDGRSYSNRQHADDLAALIRTFGGPAHVVGASAGGAVAMDLALRHPELVRTLVLSDPGVAASKTPDGKQAAMAFLSDMRRMAASARAGQPEQAVAEMVDAVYGRPGAWQTLAPERQRGFLDNAKTLLPLVANFRPPPPCEAYAGLPMPVLVMEGELTRAHFRLGNDALMACLPKGARRAVVPAAPHTWYPVNPVDGAGIILRFIGS